MYPIDSETKTKQPEASTKETGVVNRSSLESYRKEVEEGVLTEDVLSKVEEENDVQKAKTRSSIVGVNVDGSKEGFNLFKKT